jgi:hypothetical protein
VGRANSSGDCRLIDWCGAYADNTPFYSSFLFWSSSRLPIAYCLRNTSSSFFIVLCPANSGILRAGGTVWIFERRGGCMAIERATIPTRRLWSISGTAPVQHVYAGRCSTIAYVSRIERLCGCLLRAFQPVSVPLTSRERCVNSNSIWSFLHKATFRAAHCQWGLLLAIAAQGARYTRDPLQHAAKSQALFKIAKKMLDYAVRVLQRHMKSGKRAALRCTTTRKLSKKFGGIRLITCLICQCGQVRSGSA